jgi:NDP-sugar pyrophosphorylase family protein
MNVISLNETNEFLLCNGYNKIDLNIIDTVSIQTQSDNCAIGYPEYVSALDILKEYNLTTQAYNDLLCNVTSDRVEDDIFDF